MLLTKARIQNFKSINDSGEVTIDPEVTVLVGQNESGKSAFLQALTKARSAVDGIRYDVTEDYPRRVVNEYRKRHEKTPDTVATLEYQLESHDITRINEALGFEVLRSLTLTLDHQYKNNCIIKMGIAEEPYVQHLITSLNFSTDVTNASRPSKTIRELIASIEKVSLTEVEKPVFEKLKQRFRPQEQKWPSLLEQEIWLDHIGSLSNRSHPGEE